MHTQSGYEAAESALKELSKDVVLEGATGFDPSGALNVDVVNKPSDERDDTSASASSSSQQGSQDRRTQTSSTDISSNQADPSGPIPVLTTFNEESDESKVASLRAMFDDLKVFDIQHSLKKANGDFQATLDDLLNIQYLQSTGQFTRGIEGFFQPDEVTPKRKGKGKRKKGKNLSPTTDNFDIDTTTKEVLERNQAKQLQHQDEIAFLADRINMPYDQVSGIYYRKKCSSGAAAVEILDQFIKLGITSEDPDGKAEAKELSTQHGNIPDPYLLTLVQVTESGSSAAHDVAALLSKHFAKNPWTQRLDLSHRITPLPNEDLEGSLGSLTPGSKPRTPGSNLSTGPPSRASPGGNLDWAHTLQSIATHNQARHEATSHANQLSRRGGSGGLYKQAAHVYRERAQDHARYAQTMTSSAAEALVEQQSTPTSIDLHGVTVRDGARIARNRVQTWWDNLGEFRSRKAKERPFTVITGLGRHSAGGVSQLRQAVAAALLQDGWKMQVETGKFLVNGRR